MVIRTRVCPKEVKRTKRTKGHIAVLDMARRGPLTSDVFMQQVLAAFAFEE